MTELLRTEASNGTDADLLPSLHAAVEQANDAVMILECAAAGEPFRFRYVNRMFETQTGFAREEVLGKPAAILYGPETDVEQLTVWENELRAGHAIKGEILKYRRNGSSFWTEMNMRPVEHAGTALRIVASQRDISGRRAREAKLEQTQNILGAIVGNTSAATYAKDLSGRYVLVNDRFTALRGTSRRVMLGHRDEELFPDSVVESLRRSHERALAESAPVVDEERIPDASGTLRSFLSVTFPLRDENGSIFGVCGMSTDITDRVEARARLELFSYAMDAANDGICIYERDRDVWRIVYANHMFERLTGFNAHELQGRTPHFAAHDSETHEQVRRRDYEALMQGSNLRARHQMQRKDGSVFWADVNGRALIGDSGEVTHSVVLYRDITKDLVRERQLSHEASHDPLTGAFNRRYFIDALDAAIAETRSGEGRHALILFDLDGFKPVNDLHGHEAGDRLLTALATAVASRVRTHDTFARIGGDEFAVLFRDCDDVRPVAEDVLTGVRNVSLLWEGESLRVSASVGAIALGPALRDAHAALREADAACYAAKRAGKDRVEVR